MKPIRTWIVVADGARARIFLNEGTGKGLNPKPVHEMAIPLAPTRELGSDRPGRGHMQSGVRHGMQPRADWHEAEKERFAKELALQLDRSAEERSFDRLILAAPAKTLGTLRRLLGKQASGLVAGELAKDLTHAQPKDLPRHLGGVIAL
jgi:protein required for attachment to host cells